MNQPKMHRRYDLALSLLAPEQNTSEPKTWQVANAPTVRRGMTRPKRKEATVADSVLESTADSALLVASPDGKTWFDISINDSVFENLTCRIAIEPKGIVATFVAHDDNLRRLLEGESRRLRAALEDRGLKVQDVRVVTEDLAAFESLP
jgi:hypothetical protein